MKKISTGTIVVSYVLIYITFRMFRYGSFTTDFQYILVC